MTVGSGYHRNTKMAPQILALGHLLADHGFSPLYFGIWLIRAQVCDWGLKATALTKQTMPPAEAQHFADRKLCFEGKIACCRLAASACDPETTHQRCGPTGMGAHRPTGSASGMYARSDQQVPR